MNILVTGCSRGVGLEICRVLLEQGHTVYGVARSCPDEFVALQKQYPERLLYKSVDLSDSEHVRENVFEDLLPTYSVSAHYSDCATECQAVRH